MSTAALRRSVRALRWRAIAIHVASAVALTVATGLGVFAAATWIVGPAPGPFAVVLAWALTVALAAAAALRPVRALYRVRGPRIAELLVPHDEALASSLRSALELEAAPAGATWSPELVAAHHASAADRIGRLEVRAAVPWKSAWTWRRAAWVVGFALVGAALLFTGRGRAGAYALLHPTKSDSDGNAVALVVESLQANLTFPAYRRTAPLELRDVSVVEAPKGTVVEFTLRARVSAAKATLRIAGTEVPLTASANGSFHGRAVLHDSGPIDVRVARDGTWLVDGSRRSAIVIADRAPTVSLVSPREDRIIEPTETITVQYDAQDDVALGSVELVVQAPGGRTVRRELARFDDASTPSTSSTTHLLPDEVAAKPGDELSIWVEARDTDDISGPNIGRSAVRVLRLASEATRREAALANLAALVELGIDALADELERESTRPASAERASSLAFAGGLAAVPSNDTHAGVLHEMARRIERATRVAAKAAEANARLVDELERDLLLLSDLLDQARLDDAAAIARELDALRRELSSLVARYRNSPDEDTKLALLAAIQRAQDRMRKLAARLGELAKHVPTEFVNSQDLETEAQQDALARLRESVERGDLEQADRVLHELERQIDAMANALGSGVESFEATRLGARERAMAEAMSELADLELEQKDLAHRTNDSRKEATTRAIGDLRGNTPALDALAERARQARESLERVRPRELDADSKGMYELADRRLQDVATLLEAGDLGEAQKMSGEASDAVSDLARDLGLASLMFGGRGGESTDRAVRARAAETDARALEDAIDRAIPSMDNYVSEAANRQMHGDSPRQDAAREAAHRLAERFRQGPDGLPLDPDAADAVDRAKDRMADARGALAGGDVVGASRAQTDAAEELADLRRRLEQSSSKDSSGGDSGETDPRQPVEIPRETADARASDLRRKLLDGLRETAPRGYEEAVRKYYQELLR